MVVITKILFLVLVFVNQPTQELPTEKSPIEVVGISWRGAFAVGGHYESKGAFSVDVRNLSTKVVKTINWEFVLTDSVRNQEYDRFLFETDDKTIKPGEKKRLTKRFDYHSTPDYVVGRAVITRVIFEDGTSWHRKIK